MTTYTECPGGCGQQWLVPVETPYLCIMCIQNGVTLETLLEPAPTLFGGDGDEFLQLDLDEAVEHEVDKHAWRGETVYPGFTFEIEVEEYSTMPKGEAGGGRVPDGATIALHVVERWWEEFEDAYEQLETAAGQPDVIAAFQAARDLLVSKQTFLFADRCIDIHKFKITITDEHGNWDSEPIS